MVQAAVLTTPVRQAAPEPAIRVLALVPKRVGISPGQRFRLEQWAPHAAARGIAVDFSPFESERLTALLYERGHHTKKAAYVLWDFARRLRQVVQSRAYDCVVVFREAALIGPAVYERALAWLGVPLIFDFDDAIWAPSQISSVNGVFSKLHFFGKAGTTCRLSSVVTVGNEYLASYARRFNPNVVVLPTSIDLEKYPLQPEIAPPDPFVIVWSGSLHTLQHLEHARAPIERLAQRRKVTMRVICNKPPARPFAGAQNEFVAWTEKGEAEALGRAHVGIMPLPDDEFARGKCGLKALQFMAVGLPVVISPVGMNVDLIRSGVNGFLANTDDEWERALEDLAASRQLRRSVGARGRATVEEGYSATIVGARFAAAVRNAVATR